MARVLLLNPPGRKNYIRDYFCSKHSKARYQSPPATLLALSGTLAQQHEVQVLDAIAERLTVPEALQRVQGFAPDAIVSLVGEVAWDEDREFLRQAKALTRARTIGIGDWLLEDTAARLQTASGFDAALLDFVGPEVLALVAGPAGEPVANAVYRHPEEPRWVEGPRRPAQGEYHIPRPLHERFPLRLYRFPFAVARPFSVVLTDYGCPYQCGFCVIPSLGFAWRPLADVVEELEHLVRLGVREVFFIDQTFGIRRERTLALCQAMVERKLKLHWSCFSRADVTTPELLQAMATAGCHTIIYGVESGSQAVLEQYHKQLTLEQVRTALTACRQAGIRTAATFIFGLPGETEAQARATLDWALQLPLDFAAFNVAVPRAATPLRAESLAHGWVQAQDAPLDQSGRSAAMATPELSAERILSWRREAVQRFYSRPGWLLRRLFTLRSWEDLRTQWEDGWSVLAEVFFGRGGD